MARIELRKSSLLALAAVAAVSMALVPDVAHAANDFANSIDTVTQQTTGIPKLISIILYIIGIALVGKGILTGKKFSENPSSVNGGLFAVLGPVAVGALLIAAPSVASIATKSLGADGTSDVQLNSFGTVQ